MAEADVSNSDEIIQLFAHANKDHQMMLQVAMKLSLFGGLEIIEGDRSQRGIQSLSQLEENLQIRARYNQEAQALTNDKFVERYFATATEDEIKEFNMYSQALQAFSQTGFTIAEASAALGIKPGQNYPRLKGMRSYGRYLFPHQILGVHWLCESLLNRGPLKGCILADGYEI
jgi:hypothetical protein